MDVVADLVTLFAPPPGFFFDLSFGGMGAKGFRSLKDAVGDEDRGQQQHTAGFIEACRERPAAKSVVSRTEYEMATGAQAHASVDFKCADPPGEQAPIKP